MSSGGAGGSLVWDAFLFHDELDMLELRLEILDDVVDRFVLLESTVTFSGAPKPLYFTEARGRFACWADRIVHVVVDDTPDCGDDRWARERHQRDQLGRGLIGCRGSDVVYIGDVDEICRPALVAERRLGSYSLLSCQYHLNCVQERPIRAPTARLWFEVAALGAQRVRDERSALPEVPDGGWHFSSVMPVDQIHRKLASYAHSEYDTPEHHAAVADRRDRLVDLYDNIADPMEVLAHDDPRLPDVVRVSGHRWMHLMLDPGPA